MSSSSKKRLDSESVQAAYQMHGDALERFLMGVLKDRNLVSDALQISFTRLLEKGGEVESGALRAWLFRVAYNEAMLFHRKQKVDQRARDVVAWKVSFVDTENEGLRSLLKEERADQVRRALDTLPEKQKQIVDLRIREGLRFAQIAGQLKLPLGTVLTRMRSGLKKLKELLNDETNDV